MFQGMIEFRDALTDITEEFGTDDGGFEGELPEGKHFRVENKNFYFDIGQNNRGVYMRISEVKTNFRSVFRRKSDSTITNVRSFVRLFIHLSSKPPSSYNLNH